MGFTKKTQVVDLDSEGSRKWLIAGISIRASLKPVNTKPKGKKKHQSEAEDDEEAHLSTTPTSRESRISEALPCPPAPRKRRPSRCNQSNIVREFFTPPDLEAFFKCYEKPIS